MKPRAASCCLLLLSLCLCSRGEAGGQTSAWFADGYHGGVYGHYPKGFTRYMVDSLELHPEWKLNLEIEPETWDSESKNSPEDFARFKALAAGQSADGRIEFVNPAYGQAYLWNISGESVIQQFERGIAKLREHFPGVPLTTYCSEEPCFTSALPGILNSFGFRRAVLKNPNTCWGGYTRGFGGELVNWIGPDGSPIVTVPRYGNGVEPLNAGRTWETAANVNARAYIHAAFQAGIEHPVGMCLQDAGWRFGPWLDDGKHPYRPTIYTTWRNYFECVATNKPSQDWHLSQEDVQVSLVWGSQVLQRIAQQVRSAENRLVMAEKMSALADIRVGSGWPAEELDDAWRSLLLAQHHDCWIVPYNGNKNDTWADKVERWTDSAQQSCDGMIRHATEALSSSRTNAGGITVQVFNTLAVPRQELVEISLPSQWTNIPVRVFDPRGIEVPAQRAAEGGAHLLFSAAAPSLGFETYRLTVGDPEPVRGARVSTNDSGVVRVETDLYRIEVDPQHGGTIRSWVAKSLGDRELVDARAERKLNEMRGYFFERGRFLSTADRPAKVEIVEGGPVRVRLRMRTELDSNPVTQWITVVQGEPRIDFRVKIEWLENPGIGSSYEQNGGFRSEHDRKAFYEDQYKLLVQFPLNLTRQEIFKDAPFDITRSGLADTLFDCWSGIKNNVILHWVDAFDAGHDVGVALLTDHTGNYVHGPSQPLAMTVQYAGIGLWGRHYGVSGPTEVRYALLPHAGDPVRANVWQSSDAWCEPLAIVARPGIDRGRGDWAGRSLLSFDRPGWEVPTMRRHEGRTIIRLFNPSADAATRTVSYGAAASKVELVELDGRVIRELELKRSAGSGVSFELAMPRLAVRTLIVTP